MSLGTYISGAGHAGLIGWALFGLPFNSEPLPFETTDVSVISSEAFAALTATTPPAPLVTDTALPAPPEVDPAPQTPAQETPAPVPATPDPVVETAPDPAPDVSEIAPLPDTDVTDAPPIVPAAPEVLAPPSAPLSSVRPQPRPAPRVAPEPVAPPAPDAAVAPDVQEAVTLDPEGIPSETPLEDQDATAPEEATTEIVTEAEEPDLAPTRSIRPKTRPTRPAVAQEQPPQDESPTPSPDAATEPATELATEQASEQSVADALAEALAATPPQAPAAPAGPPLTSGERDALRVSVSTCWNVGSLSSEALATTVTVAVDMTADGKPVTSTVRMVSSSGGSQAAAKQAYEAARRAIIRCGNSGFDLPPEKYDQWKEIEMTFNPEQMRIK